MIAAVVTVVMTAVRHGRGNVRGHHRDRCMSVIKADLGFGRGQPQSW